MNAIMRFWNKVATRSKNECWLWLTGKTKAGYGSFWFEGINWQAHRMAYLLANGPFDMKLHILHSCDIKLCCNPKHLFSGTHLDNIQDKVKKGRQAKGEKVSHSGETNGRSKLTKVDVKDIRVKSKAGISRSELSRQYSVTKQSIGHIVNRQTWIR